MFRSLNICGIAFKRGCRYKFFSFLFKFLEKCKWIRQLPSDKSSLINASILNPIQQCNLIEKISKFHQIHILISYKNLWKQIAELLISLISQNETFFPLPHTNTLFLRLSPFSPIYFGFLLQCNFGTHKVIYSNKITSITIRTFVACHRCGTHFSSSIQLQRLID